MISRVPALRLRAWLTKRTVALDIGDEQFSAVWRSEDRAWIPAGGDHAEPETALNVSRRSIFFQVQNATEAHYRHAVIRTVSYVERFAVGTEGKSIAAATERHAIIGPAVDSLRDNVLLHVNH